ncbi:hypothetical protein C9I57_24785 [Trinickia symbiotica]|uniref:DUF2844 domain-containing protein n=1 Tax=Trinickia symbiotica TaxID=863227 RepID=A0A2T3XNG2_9BURK|nr:DUF2844 domain-containing protein [Trinickia symbiotica]PTB18053.1 hypothetical protein C9I57_24785 [Trinickia symbiotica]
MFIRSIQGTLPAVVAACALLAVTSPAHAALGGEPMQTPSGATVDRMSTVAHAASSTSSSTTSTSTYTVKQTTLETGTVIREYIGSDGTVFGIAWQGAQMPDLSTLLGSYFPQVQSAVAAQREQRGGGRGPTNVEQSGLVVHVGGHMGSFVGQAYLPSALPSGVAASDIQ